MAKPENARKAAYAKRTGYFCQKKWAKRNGSYFREKMRAAYAKNPEKFRAKRRAFRMRHLERLKLVDKEWRDKNPSKVMWKSAKTRAKKYGMAFDISVDDVVIPERCPILGIKLRDGTVDGRATIDKKIPSLGYVKGNVSVISHRANRLKSDASLEELYAILNYLGGDVGLRQ